MFFSIPKPSSLTTYLLTGGGAGAGVDLTAMDVASLTLPLRGGLPPREVRVGCVVPGIATASALMGSPGIFRGPTRSASDANSYARRTSEGTRGITVWS
eukprot:1148954-Prymnesium_polylepis.2